jgi:hypothetical protein
MTLTGEIRPQSLKNDYINTNLDMALFLILSILLNKRKGLIYITIIIYRFIYLEVHAP